MTYTEIAQGAYDCSWPSPYLFTSNNDRAWRIGQWLQQTGRSRPRDVRPSRGDTFHVNGMKVKFDESKRAIERVA